MPRLKPALSVLVALLVTTVVSHGAEDSAKAIIQSVPPGVPVDPANPPLKLSDQQRARIREVVANENTDVSFADKAVQGTETFEPKAGAKLPKDLESQAFPERLTREMPLLRRFTYLKFKNQTLVIDPMTKTITDVIPQPSQ